MHFVNLRFEPTEKSPDAVPTIVLVIVFRIFATSFLAIDHELLIGLGQLFEWNTDVDFFAGAGAEQIFLRITELVPTKNANHALFDRQGAVRNRFVQIDRNRASETATFGTGAQRIVETEKAGRRRANVEIAMRAMPADGKRMLGVFLNVDDVDLALAETKRGLERFNQTGAVLLVDRDAVLNDLNASAELQRFL